MKLNLFQNIARYLLGLIYLFGAVDGVGELFFDYYFTGESPVDTFHGALQHTTYFWAFLKFCELIGAISLLANYKPALGVAILTPISAVLCLFYAFDLHWYIALTLVGGLTLTLLWAYRSSYAGLWDDYSRRETASSTPAGPVARKLASPT